MVLMSLVVAPLSGATAQSSPPVVRLLRADEISSARARLRAGDTTLAPAYDRLLSDAKAALTLGPWAVTDKKALAPSGDRHDYMSFGPYWWPDTTKPNGLPYIRRDGQVNPGSRGAESNSPSFQRMAATVSTLALAYYFSGDETYARRATLLLRTWFIAPETRMNPNLRYGQAIPGVTDGRGIGLIDTRELSSIADAVGLLRASSDWTPADDRAMHDWARDFLQWMRTSPQGQEESKATNNHGSWYDVQLVALAYFVGDSALAGETLRTSSMRRIEGQIHPDGRQPRELERTRSLSYSEFNLEALTRLAELARFAKLDLWHHAPAAGGGIAAALRYLAPYADTTQTWAGAQITPPDPLELLTPLRRAERALHDPVLHAALERMPVAARASHRSRLLYPTGP
ncbi:MAG: alginate lyase family protein [Gemmatimonadaceae bacterium]